MKIILRAKFVVFKFMHIAGYKPTDWRKFKIIIHTTEVDIKSKKLLS